MSPQQAVVTLGQQLIYAPLGTVGEGDDVVDVPVLMSRPALYFPVLLKDPSDLKGEKMRAGAVIIQKDALRVVMEMGGGVAVPTAPGPGTFPIVWQGEVLSQFPPHAALYVYKSPELDALMRLSNPQRSIR